MIGFYYKVKWFIKDIPSKIRRIEAFFQRGKRGWAYSDTWNMDAYLITVILPMLKYLKASVHGYPAYLSSVEEWNCILDQMINGFEAGKRICDDEYIDKIQPSWYNERSADIFNSNITDDTFAEYRKRLKEDEEAFHKGMEVFNKYFFGLWD